MMAPVLFLLLAAVPVFAGPGDQGLMQYTDYEDRIINGDLATIDEFPFLVSQIYFRNKTKPRVQHGCGGTIITQDWVLTAAHCADPDHTVPDFHMKLIMIRAGSSFADRRGILRGFTEIVSHKYPPHDIALVKVDEPWPLNGITISLAPLPRQDDPVPVGSTATIMGWGDIDAKGNTPEILMKQEVVVISTTFCNDTWMYWDDKEVDEKKICTLFKRYTNETGILSGDSGSPVVVNGVVVGLVSWYHYTLRTVPNFHTRVSAYIDWIEETVGPLPRAK